MHIKKNKFGIFEVESTTEQGKYYFVDLKNLQCSCLANVYGHICKHIKELLVRLSDNEVIGIEYENLPKSLNTKKIEVN